MGVFLVFHLLSDVIYTFWLIFSKLGPKFLPTSIYQLTTSSTSN